MKHFLSVIFLILTLAVAQESMALSCTLTDGTERLEESIPNTVTLPPLSPKGTIAWRSKTYNLSLKCWHPTEGTGDYVFAFFGSEAYFPPIVDIGDQLEPGIRFSLGGDKTCSEMPVLGGCATNTWNYVEPCTKPEGCPEQAITFNYQFSSLLAVKTPGNGYQDGQIINPAPARYPLIQFRGARYSSSSSDKVVTLYLTGLENLHYSGCSSTIDISPRTINFERVSASTARAGTTARVRPLTLTATKACTTPYGLVGNFQPVAGTLNPDKVTLVPTNNNSVGIQIIDKDTNKALPFKQDFFIAPTTNTDLVHRKNLEARLVWMKNTATLGEFNATAKLDVYYK